MHPKFRLFLLAVKRYLVSIFASMMFCLFFLIGTANAQLPTAVQFNITNDTDYPYFANTGGTYVLAQGADIIPDKNMWACGLSIKLTMNPSCTRNSSTTINLYEDVDRNGSYGPGMAPYQLTLVDKNYSEASLTVGANPPTQTNFMFDTCYLLSVGHRYTLSVRRQNPTATSCYQTSRRLSSEYAGTKYWYNLPISGGWVSDANKEYGFKILGMAGSAYQSPAMATTTCDVMAGTYGEIGRWTCGSLLWAFVPPPETSQEWQNKREDMAKRVPFGYLYAFQPYLTQWTGYTTSTHLIFNFWVPNHPEFATGTLDVTQAYLDAPQTMRDFARVWLIRIVWFEFFIYLLLRARGFFGQKI